MKKVLTLVTVCIIAVCSLTSCRKKYYNDFHTSYFYLDYDLLDCVWESTHDPGFYYSFYDDGIVMILRDMDMYLDNDHFYAYGYDLPFDYYDNRVAVYDEETDEILLEMRVVDAYQTGTMNGYYEIIGGEYYYEFLNMYKGAPEVFMNVSNECVTLEFTAAVYSANGRTLEITKDYVKQFDSTIKYTVKNDKLTFKYKGRGSESFIRTYFE